VLKTDDREVGEWESELQGEVRIRLRSYALVSFKQRRRLNHEHQQHHFHSP